MAVIVLNVLWFLSFSGVLSYYFYQPTVSDCGWCSLQGMWCDILKVFGCCHSENTLLMFNYLPTWGAGEGKGKGCVMAVGGWTPLDGFIYTLALTPSISALWLRVKREKYIGSNRAWRRRSVSQRGCRSRLGPRSKYTTDKNCKNRLRLAKVIVKNKMSCFFYGSLCTMGLLLR